MSQALDRLMKWYEAQCDEEWEHAWGVKIGTLDNPGWLVKINLNGTPLESEEFKAVVTDRSPTNWVHCSVERREGRGPDRSALSTFVGAGGAKNLQEIITLFCDWADARAAAAPRPSRRRSRR